MQLPNFTSCNADKSWSWYKEAFTSHNADKSKSWHKETFTSHNADKSGSWHKETFTSYNADKSGSSHKEAFTRYNADKSGVMIGFLNYKLLYTRTSHINSHTILLISMKPPIGDVYN